MGNRSTLDNTRMLNIETIATSPADYNVMLDLYSALKDMGFNDFQIQTACRNLSDPGRIGGWCFPIG